jgi:hypothetical protein
MSSKKKKAPASKAGVAKLPSLDALFGRNIKAEEEGVWKDFVLPQGTISLKLRSFQCKASIEHQEKLRKPHLALFRKSQTDKDDEAVQDEALKVGRQILEDTLAEIIILDWKGIGDADGKPLACSKTNILAALRNESLQEFFSTVLVLASDRETFRQSNLKAAEKN